MKQAKWNLKWHKKGVSPFFCSSEGPQTLTSWSEFTKWPDRLSGLDSDYHIHKLTDRRKNGVLGQPPSSDDSPSVLCKALPKAEIETQTPISLTVSCGRRRSRHNEDDCFLITPNGHCLTVAVQQKRHALVSLQRGPSTPVLQLR